MVAQLERDPETGRFLTIAPDGADAESENGEDGLYDASADLDDPIVAIIECGDLEAIREELSDSQDRERKALTKWVNAERRYGQKLRDARATYEARRDETTRLFTAATRGLA